MSRKVISCEIIEERFEKTLIFKTIRENFGIGFFEIKQPLREKFKGVLKEIGLYDRYKKTNL